MIRLITRTMGVALAGALASLALSTAALAADGAAVAERCVVCHGKNGASTEPQIPIIGGYSAKYISDSIRNFRKKTRPCAEVATPSGPKKGTKSDMCKVTAELSDAEAEAVAKHFAAQKFVRAKQPFDAAKAQKGSTVYKLRCEKCHENNGASADEDNGILAGQWTPYLRDQLVAFRAGRRPSDEKMKQRLERVNKEEEEALLHFFASQQ
jgi:cytochrome subunit of sulfide dehydrogenase